MLYDRDTGRKELAHRVAWKLEHGVYPTGTLLHGCDNSRCVRLKHLTESTQKANMVDMARKRRSGNDHRAATLEDAAKMREMYAAGFSQMGIAKQLGFHQTYVSRVLAGQILKLL